MLQASYCTLHVWGQNTVATVCVFKDALVVAAVAEEASKKFILAPQSVSWLELKDVTQQQLLFNVKHHLKDK